MSAQPRITLDQWSALAAVVDAGGYAKAAERLHKSQSSVTYAVQQLESQLGVKAFRIEGRKNVLTPTGELLYRRARYLLDEAMALERESKRLSAGWEAQIRLAVETVFPSWLVLHCLDRFGAEAPNTRIELIGTVLGHRTDLLASGAADLAVYPVVPAGFTGEALMRARFALFASLKHPLHKLGRRLTQRDLRKHRHLVIRESSPDRANPASVDVTQRWTLTHVGTAIEAARAGYGFVLLPEDLVRDELAAGALKELPLPGTERFVELYLIYADREHAGPGALRLGEILRETVRSECKEGGAKSRSTRRPYANALFRPHSKPAS